MEPSLPVTRSLNENADIIPATDFAPKLNWSPELFEIRRIRACRNLLNHVNDRFPTVIPGYGHDSTYQRQNGLEGPRSFTGMPSWRKRIGSSGAKFLRLGGGWFDGCHLFRPRSNQSIQLFHSSSGRPLSGAWHRVSVGVFSAVLEYSRSRCVALGRPPFIGGQRCQRIDQIEATVRAGQRNYTVAGTDRTAIQRHGDFPSAHVQMKVARLPR